MQNLPFDIRDRNAIAYGDNLPQLVKDLNARLVNLTHIPSQ